MKKIFLHGLISVFILFIYIVWINKKYNIYMAKSSSCGTNILCNPVYDLTVSGRPISKPLCKNLTSCVDQTMEYDDDSSISLDFSFGDFRIPQIGCVTLPDPDKTKICCSGDLAICYATQLLLKNDFNTYRGYSLPFTSNLCRALPSCFIENDSTPYLLFPISDFSIKVYDDDSDYLLNPDFEHDSLNIGVAKAFGSLGAMPLSKSQGCVYALTLPKKDTFSYFSLTPYLFQTGRPELVNNFPTDLPFSSITDAFNYKNLENMNNPFVTKWLNGDIDKVTIFVIMTHNKNLAEKIYNKVATNIQSIIDKYNIPVSDDSIILNPPITCIPIPAGSTYGNSYNPFDQKMLADENNTDRGTNTNKNYKSETPLFDWKSDTIGLVGRIASKNPDADNDDNDPYTIWKNNFQDQSNCFVLGLDEKSAQDKDTYDYVPFELKDQNGRFLINENGQGYWAGACEIDEIKDNHTIDSYKKQKNYDSGDLIIKGENNNKVGSIDTRMEMITEQMKNIGYDVFTDVLMESDPSPFPYYNEYVNKIKGDIEKYRWSQAGVDLLQYNVSTFGDCRDTIYPTSHNFCLGKYDVAVIVANNFSNNTKVPIGYNNLNLYDAQYQTSLASYRGDSVIDDDCFSLAVSRSDLTCLLDSSKNTSSIIDSFQYINTGPHTSVYGTPTTSFFTQSRVYYDKETGVSPNMSSKQARYLVRVFKPCENKKPVPSICYDYETEKCIQNKSHSECSNDLTVKNKESNDDSEKISAGLCQFLRIDKTTNKTYATAYTFTLAGLFIVFTVIGIVYIIKNRKNFKNITTDYNYLLIPYLCIFIAAIISYRKINYITDQTAFDVKQTELQNNI